MNYSRHCLTASVTMWPSARTRQPMTGWLALLVDWSVRQKLNRVSSVQFTHVAMYARFKHAIVALRVQNNSLL